MLLWLLLYLCRCKQKHKHNHRLELDFLGTHLMSYEIHSVICDMYIHASAARGLIVKEKNTKCSETTLEGIQKKTEIELKCNATQDRTET